MDLFEKLARDFCNRYVEEGLKSGTDKELLHTLITHYHTTAQKELKNPTPFSIYHEALPKEHAFGLDFFRPLIVQEESKILGQENLADIEAKRARGENVFLLANHQTEPDPQAISLLLEKPYPHLSHDMIYVAGDRVVRDAMAIPLSLGCNLLCIYSKKYIDTPPEKREEKLLHNRRTLGKMEELLREGGKVIYVAASGGRDRKEADGTLKPALFNPESVELLHLIARKSGSKTHFHTLAMKSYDLLPPPSSINIELGEVRLPGRTPVHLYFGKELNLDITTGGSRHALREIRSTLAYQQLLDDYQKIDI